jgi:hypothetical protein
MADAVRQTQSHTRFGNYRVLLLLTDSCSSLEVLDGGKIIPFLGGEQPKDKIPAENLKLAGTLLRQVQCLAGNGPPFIVCRMVVIEKE